MHSKLQAALAEVLLFYIYLEHIQFEKIIQKWNSEYRWTLSGVVTWRRSALWATNRQRAE